VRFFIVAKNKLIMPIRKSELDAGTYHTAEIDRISSSGNGIIEFVDGGHANLGEMDDDMVGEIVRFKYRGDGQVTYNGEMADENVNPIAEDPTDNKNDILDGHL
jgi:hypothetical protein